MKVINSPRLEEDCLITCQECDMLPYNSKVNPTDLRDIYDVCDGQVTKIRGIDNYVINPRPSIFKKVDNRKHILYFIDGSHFSGSWGGHILYEDSKVNKIQEKLFVRASFVFYVTNGELTIPLLTSDGNTFTSHYINEKIRNMISNPIIQHLSIALNDEGLVRLQESIGKVSNDIQMNINDDILQKYGIAIDNLSLVIEEDEKHAKAKSSYCWKKLK